MFCMKSVHKLYLSLKVLFVMLLCSSVSIDTIGANDSIATNKTQISLLTCSPDDGEVYSFFGHSAVRLQNKSMNLDVVFDYGVFSFDTPYFILKFIKGDTDYIVINRSFQNFQNEFASRGVEVKEQIFNLSDEDVDKISQYLIWNIQEENRVYRYNFLENNCSSKIYDIIHDQLGERVTFAPDTIKQTYRDLINEHLVVSPWYKMGINLIIGSAADTIVTDRQKVFLPEYLYRSFDAATLSMDSLTQKLVLEDNLLLKADDRNQNFKEHIVAKKDIFDTPFYFGIIIVLLVVIMTIFCENKRILWIPRLFDFVLFSLSSICGLIIVYLMFFSSHPCVGANWNLIWLNPLPILLIGAIFVGIKSRRKCILLYHFINFVLILIFFVGVYFMPQKFEIAFIPYIILLWLRSGYKLLRSKKRK